MSERENGWYWHTDDFGGSTLCRWVASNGRLVIGRFDSRMGGFSYRDDQLTPVARPAEVAALRAEVAKQARIMAVLLAHASSAPLTDEDMQWARAQVAALEPTR